MTIQSPAKPRGWINLGNEASRESDLDTATAAYYTAVRRAQRPERSRDERALGASLAYANLGLLAWDRGETDWAQFYVARAQRLAPRSPEVHAVALWIARIPSPPSSR